MGSRSPARLFFSKKLQFPGQYLVTKFPGDQIPFATKLHPAANLSPVDGLVERFLGAFENGVFCGRVESILSPRGQSPGLYAFPAKFRDILGPPVRGASSWFNAFSGHKSVAGLSDQGHRSFLEIFGHFAGACPGRERQRLCCLLQCRSSRSLSNLFTL